MSDAEHALMLNPPEGRGTASSIGECISGITLSGTYQVSGALSNQEAAS